MRKILIILLILIAIPLYTYNVYVLLKGSLKGNAEKSLQMLSDERNDISIHTILAAIDSVHFKKQGRSPFVPYPVSDKPPVVKSRAAVNNVVQKTAAEVPKVTVNGIMWNPQNPLAMLGLPDGSSVVAKAGQVLGNITVKKIGKTFVVIMYDRKEYTISR